MTTPTPRTDAVAIPKNCDPSDWVSADFARQLERDLAAREEELAAALGRAYRAEVAIGPLAASIVSAQQRVEKAEAELARTQEAFESLTLQVSELELSRDAAVKALKIYGRHLDNCGDEDAYNQADVRSCGCGLDAAMEKGER